MVVNFGGEGVHVLKCCVLWFKLFESFVGDFSSKWDGGKRKSFRGPCNLRCELYVCVSAQAYVCVHVAGLSLCCMCSVSIM